MALLENNFPFEKIIQDFTHTLVCSIDGDTRFYIDNIRTVRKAESAQISYLL